VPFEDVMEVSNYVAALEHGIQDGFPLCNCLIREMHALLLSRGRGGERAPGEFRRTQNWIGGTRQFVPPPADEVERCMGDLERFLNGENAPTRR